MSEVYQTFLEDVMKRLLHLGVAVLVVLGLLYAQQSHYISESVLLERMFTRVSDGLVYCYSDKTKTTGTAVKKTKDGTWFITSEHKVDADFPLASKIYIKENRERGAKVYESTKIITPEQQGLDLLLFFVEDFKAKYVFKTVRPPYKFEENWVFGFRGGADKVPGSAGYVTSYFADRRFVFTSASIWFGCSGSPVLNRDGEVLGLAVRMAEGSTDGLFIDGKIVKEFIDNALKSQGK
jgi:hypothetical protein